MGLYIVSEYTDHYYHKDKYYRWRDGGWERSSHVDGKWKKISTKRLPSGLKAENTAREKEKQKKEEKDKKGKKGQKKNKDKKKDKKEDE
jgi:hypothetical protein